MITLLNHLNSVHAKSSIAGGFLLTLLLYFVSCSNNKDGKIESSVASFDECIYPRGAVVYRNYLIIVGENTSHEDSPELLASELNNSDIRKIFVYNLVTDKADPELQNKIFKEGIKWLYVKNDSLFGRFSTENELIDSWSFWDGNKWIKSYPFTPAARFETSYLRQECSNIFEDDEYMVYSYNQGEFGNAVIFLEKSSGILRGYPLVAPRQVIKDSSGYIVFGRLDHLSTIYDVIHLKHPERLPIVPDSLIKYDYTENSDESILLYLDHYLRCQLSLNNDCKDKRVHLNEPSEMDCYNCFESGQKYITYQSANKSMNSVVKLILQDSSGIYCQSIFKYHKKLFCVLNDNDYWYLCKMNNLSSQKIQNNYIIKIPQPSLIQTSSYFGDSYLLIYCYSDMDIPCLKFTGLIINDQFIKTYHFSPEQD